MTEQALVGLAASPGVAAGLARVLDVAVDLAAAPLPEPERASAAEQALAALAAAATEIDELAAELEQQGSTAEAEIVATGSLMAADPGLAEAVRSAVLADGASPPAAILAATDAYAGTLAAIDDPTLQLRSDDVRSLGRRAARLATGNGRERSRGVGADAVLVASDLGPADVAELGGSVRAVALAAGGTTAHAAIVARSLGVPMVVGAGEDLLRLAEPGTPIVVDGDAGTITVAPGSEARRRAHLASAERMRERERSLAARGLPAETLDGHRIRVLANVATPSEVAVALPAGAEGIGLLRTELSFLSAGAWPSAEDHRRALSTTLAPLENMVATVRLLDFGGDKTPPFLAGCAGRGIALLLAAPDALREQAVALAAVAGHTQLRVLLPMVEQPEQVEAVRSLFADATGITPPFGAMIETREGIERLDEIASAADFLSVGTNDLTHSLLSTDRFAPGESAAHHPHVLRAIAAVVDAARAHQLVVEVCGEAASHPVTMPLLLGSGVNELSVGAARVGQVRRWIRMLDFDRTVALAEAARELDSAGTVVDLMSLTTYLLGEAGDAAAESVEGSLGVIPVGRQA
jgi:phosphoenolpyruvate-protein kinase (PTS system EI component)